MIDRLPIGVLLPVYNCRSYLPGHLDALRQWAGLAEEIVVVDSFSDDGTLELLREQLPHARFLSHPRGLYQSWNFGISQITAKYTYISTVGDVLSRDGLPQLTAVAEQTQADVVLSPPRFITPDGQPFTGWCWPIHRLIEWQAMARPTVIQSLHAFLMTTLHLPEGILGSSASNLYRTGFLKERPFPVEYGHTGDTVWGLLHSLRTRFAVTPTVLAQFMVHPKPGTLDDEQAAKLLSRLLDVALEACRAEAIPELPAVVESWRAEVLELRSRQVRYDRWRKSPWPWILNPRAWQLRSRRNHQRRRLRKLKETIRARFVLEPGPR